MGNLSEKVALGLDQRISFLRDEIARRLSDPELREPDRQFLEELWGGAVARVNALISLASKPGDLVEVIHTESEDSFFLRRKSDVEEGPDGEGIFLLPGSMANIFQDGKWPIISFPHDNFIALEGDPGYNRIASRRDDDRSRLTREILITSGEPHSSLPIYLADDQTWPSSLLERRGGEELASPQVYFIAKKRVGKDGVISGEAGGLYVLFSDNNWRLWGMSAAVTHWSPADREANTRSTRGDSFYNSAFVIYAPQEGFIANENLNFAFREAVGKGTRFKIESSEENSSEWLRLIQVIPEGKMSSPAQKIRFELPLVISGEDVLNHFLDGASLLLFKAQFTS